MKYTLTLLFLYKAEVRYALRLRQLSSKIQSGYVTRKSRIQWFDVEDGINFTSETDFIYFYDCETRAKIFKILPHEWNRFHIQGQNHWFFYYIFFGDLTCFSRNLRHCMLYMTWRHNSLFFHTVKKTLLTVKNNNLWRQWIFNRILRLKIYKCISSLFCWLL